MRLIFAFLLATPLLAMGQLTVDDGITAESAVIDILAGGGVNIQNITFSGDNNQIGAFNSENSNVGLNSGIILSSGSVLGAIGPNNTSSHTEAGGNMGATDPDLEILTGAANNDAAVLEFDFVPAGDSVVFQYVFASEEYNEYVCSDFNDAFGFFLSGPGISGIYSNDAINIALVPESDVQVSINSVNNGNVGAFGDEAFCSNLDPDWVSNSQYFVDNEPSADANATQFDGLTVVLTASALVTCGETYHIKLAVADAFDDNLDSAVFLEAGSLESQGYHTAVVTSPELEGIDDNAVVEGCSSALIHITRPEFDLQEILTLTVAGDAINGVDYVEIPNTVIFDAGQETVTFEFTPLSDEDVELPEHVVVYFAYQNSCGTAVSQSIELQIVDYQPLSMEVDEEVVLCPNANTTLTAISTGGYEPLTYLWDDEPGDNSFTISEGMDMISVSVSDQCGSVEEALISVSEVTPFEGLLASQGCIEVGYNPEFTGGLAPIELSWAGDNEPLWEDGEVIFPAEGTFELTWTDACDQEVFAEVEISSCALVIPNVFSPNNDTHNDYLRIDGLENWPGSRLEIYNRWGALVFSSADYLNNWDAYGVNDGTYFLTLELPDGNSHSSSLTILR